MKKIKNGEIYQKSMKTSKMTRITRFPLLLFLFFFLSYLIYAEEEGVLEEDSMGDVGDNGVG